MNKIIGRNIRTLREANKFTQSDVATFLGIERSAYANYEAGLRDMPLIFLEKTAELLGCELDVLFEEDIEKLKNVLTCAFRVDNLESQDIEQIAKFKGIVNSYLKINQLLKGNED